MEATFALVLIVVVAVATVMAIWSLRHTGELYRSIGKGGLSLDEPDRPSGPAPGSPAARAEADAEIRQMLEAKSARREARGEEALDVEAELRTLTQAAPAADPGLREEVRQHVIARNERRVRRGQEPLEVEAEVDRQLRDAGG